MWSWFMSNSIWVLLGFGALVLLILLFNEKVRNLIVKLEPEKWQGKAYGSITAIFWTIEGISVLIVIVAFIALVFSEEGAGTLLTTQSIRTWFTQHGTSNIVILAVGILLWVVIKQAVPPMVGRVITRPRKGESREGLKRRDTQDIFRADKSNDTSLNPTRNMRF